MATRATNGAFSTLSPSLRSAGIIALATAILASVLLFQTNRNSSGDPNSGGSLAGKIADPNSDLTVPTPTPVPLPTGESRSSAVLTAPTLAPGFGQSEGPSLPAIGRYVYDINGTESASVFGSRAYPGQMVMSVHRPDNGTKSDELTFDLDFSADHQEHETVAFHRNGIMFTHEAGTITFGPRTQKTDASYLPAMLQVPLPLEVGAQRSGSSRVLTPDGTESRVQDWTVRIDGTEKLSIENKQIDAWVVETEETSQAGTSDQLTRTRKYWVDPERSIWVQWDEHVTSSQPLGPGTFNYRTDFTATLNHVEPL